MNMLWYALAIPLIYLTSDIYIYISPKLHRNTQIQDTCIVFRSWHISSNPAFVFSCLAILALGVFFVGLDELRDVLRVPKASDVLQLEGRNPPRPFGHGPLAGFGCRFTRFGRGEAVDLALDEAHVALLKVVQV